MKTQAQIVAERFANKSVELMFTGEALPTDWCQWVRDNVPSPQGAWHGSNHYGNRGPLLAVVEYDDGSHLDVLKGTVFAW